MTDPSVFSLDIIVWTIAASCLFLAQVAAFDNTRYDNVSPILSSNGSLLNDECIGSSVRLLEIYCLIFH